MIRSASDFVRQNHWCSSCRAIFVCMCMTSWHLVTLVTRCLWLLKTGQLDFFCGAVEEMKLMEEILTAFPFPLLFPWHNLSSLSAAVHDTEAYICSLFCFFFSLSCLQAWISSPIAQRNVKHWATQIGAGCLPLFHPMDAKLRITAAICTYLAWTPFQTLKCLKHQKPSPGQKGPSPPLAKRRPFTTVWKGRSSMDCCLIHERLTNHHIWVSTVQKKLYESVPFVGMKN